MKNGLPSDRRWIRATRSGSVGTPSIASSSAAVWSFVRRERESRCMRPVRSSSPSHGSAGCRRCSSSERSVIATRTRSERRVRTRKPRVSRVAGSDQWTSSISTRTGATAASRRSTPTRASNRRAWSQACWSGAPDAPGSSAGTSRARSAPDVPTTVSRRSGSSSRTSWPRISTIGPYGRPSSPTFAHAPRRTSTPRASAAAASSAASRLLPTPASPAISRWAGVPSTAASSAASAASSSARRPIVMGLTRRPAMPAIIRKASYPCRMGQRTTIASVIPPPRARSGRGARRPRRPRCARRRRACPGCSTRGRPRCSR